MSDPLPTMPNQAQLRSLAVKWTVDPRTIVRCLRGERIRGEGARRNAAMACAEWVGSEACAEKRKEELAAAGRVIERNRSPTRRAAKAAPKRARKARKAAKS